MTNANLYLEEASELLMKAHGLTFATAHVQVKADIDAEYPMGLGIVTRVTYLDKADQYVIRFGASGIGTHTAKVTPEVAEHLLTHGFRSGAKPFVHAHMADGLIDGVLLVYLSREGGR